MDREQSKTVMVLQQLLRGNQAHFLSISGGAWAANTIIPHPCPSFKASILGLSFRPRDGLLTDLSPFAFDRFVFLFVLQVNKCTEMSGQGFLNHLNIVACGLDQFLQNSKDIFFSQRSH